MGNVTDCVAKETAVFSFFLFKSRILEILRIETLKTIQERMQLSMQLSFRIRMHNEQCLSICLISCLDADTLTKHVFHPQPLHYNVLCVSVWMFSHRDETCLSCLIRCTILQQPSWNTTQTSAEIVLNLYYIFLLLMVFTIQRVWPAVSCLQRTTMRPTITVLC